MDVPDRFTDVEVAKYLLGRYVFVHLGDDRLKFDLLMFVLRALKFVYVVDACLLCCVCVYCVVFVFVFVLS